MSCSPGTIRLTSRGRVLGHAIQRAKAHLDLDSLLEFGREQHLRVKTTGRSNRRVSTDLLAKHRRDPRIDNPEGWRPLTIAPPHTNLVTRIP
jgi:hypothetical protein